MLPPCACTPRIPPAALSFAGADEAEADNVAEELVEVVAPALLAALLLPTAGEVATVLVLGPEPEAPLMVLSSRVLPLRVGGVVVVASMVVVEVEGSKSNSGSLPPVLMASTGVAIVKSGPSPEAPCYMRATVPSKELQRWWWRATLA